ncbi:MAG: hypothetical protein U9P14_11805, partial [Gemmatimonadota bacterium]|nr:hypothetical protein [Gemmatimonadota bacterium]
GGGPGPVSNMPTSADEYSRIAPSVKKQLANRAAATRRAGLKPCPLCGLPRGESRKKRRYPDYCDRCQEDARQIMKKLHYLELRKRRGLND